jgi:hypothetical protein
LGHNWDEGKVTKEATDTEEGVLTYTCQNGCGETYTELIKAKGHKYEVTDQKDATCTEKGHIIYTCTTCDDTYTTELPVIAHDYQAGEVVAPICTEKGYTVYTCTMCKDSYKDDYTDEVAHTAGDPVKENEVAATCTEEGSYDSVVYCTVCGGEISREEVTVDALGHKSETIPAVEATCTSTGLTEGQKCSTCGEILEEQKEIPVLDHEFSYKDNGDGTHAVTCKNCDYNETEVHSYENGVCSACGAKEPEEPVEPDECDHTYLASFQWEEDNTCTATFTCKDCGDTHTVDAQVTVEETPATCTENGERVYTAVASYGDMTVDNQGKTEVIPMTGHSYVDTVIAPTETKKGYTEHVCSACGDTYRDSYTDPTGTTVKPAAKPFWQVWFEKWFGGFNHNKPSEPSKPDTSTEPDKSSEPDASTEPDKSSEPDTSTEPDKSSEPDTSTEPDESTEPDAPAEPDKPSEPDTPAEPDEPSEPETPNIITIIWNWIKNFFGFGH